MPKRRIVPVTLVTALAISAGPALAQVYSWEDKDGTTVFSDTPPENRPVEQIDPSENANPAIPLPEPRQRPTRPSSSRNSSSSSSNSREDRAQQRRCERIDSRLETINTRLRRGYREPTGNRLRSQRRDLQQERYRDCR